MSGRATAASIAVVPTLFHTIHFRLITFARAQGGKTRLDNLAYACLGCNGAKRDQTVGIDPLTAKKAKLFHPRRQHWADHFGWNHDFTQMIGLTPAGRATVDALDLNRSGLRAFRKLLRQANVHPPE